MTRAKSVQEFRRGPDVEARIISAIGSAGPRNVAQIARMTGVHQETVRYKIKRQFVDKGFRFRADVDYGNFGLSLHWGTFVLSPAYYGSATKLFRSMNEAAYLVHFSKVLPQGHFVALFALPEGKAEEFKGFLEGLKRRRIVAEFSLDPVLAQRHKTMDPSFFNFRKGRWEVEWDKVRKVRSSPLAGGKGQAELGADYTDLLIVKELQKDARQHIAQIARKLKLNPKNLEYHYKTHVMNGGLIRGFMVRWMKDADESLARSTVTMRLAFNGLEGRRYSKVQSAINRLPYLWVEDLLEGGTYVATLAVPLTDFAPTMKYLNEELQFLGGVIDTGYLSVEDSWNYTIPYQMFSDGGWRFDVRKMGSTVAKGLRGAVEK
jgi:DNA-binding Lrp family transcriptional regulator